jgi:hypothetical protein
MRKPQQAHPTDAQRSEQSQFVEGFEESVVRVRLIVPKIDSFVPKNVITRSLGPNPEVQIDLEGPFPVQVGDTFLLCSDGLSGPVEDDEIGTLVGCLPPGEAARALVDLANLRGGPDNITVIVARVTGPDLAQGGSANRPRGRRATRPVSPLLWTLLGGFALAAVGLGAVGYLVPAVASLLGFVGAGIAAFAYRYGGADSDGEFDGQPLGKPYDGYHGLEPGDRTVLRSDEVTFGTVRLSAGTHVFRFQVVGRNPKSRGYMIGLDLLEVVGAEPAQP